MMGKGAAFGDEGIQACTCPAMPWSWQTYLRLCPLAANQIRVLLRFQLLLHAAKLEVRKAYRQLALKLHPDKQTKDCRD